MGTQHGGNGDNVPPDGDQSRDPELPDLPPEWGRVDIPDDLSELSEEAEQIRQELARERRERDSTKPHGEPSIGVPLLIMSVAVVITLISLFAMTWSGSNTVNPDGASTERPNQLPALSLTDADGDPVSLADHLPMAIMLVEECDCAALLAATVDAAPPGVTVAAIDDQAPARPPGLAPENPPPLLLADPAGRVRAQLDLAPPTNAATVVLVDGDGQITSIQQAVTAVAQFQPDLINLAST